MPPLREKLMPLVACLVAIDLAVAVVVLQDRAGASARVAAPAAPVATANGSPSTTAAGGAVPGGIFAGVPFRHRRGTVTFPTATTSPAGASSQVAAGPTTSTAGSARSTGSPSTRSTRPRSTGGSGSTGSTTSTAPADNGAYPDGSGAPASSTGELDVPSGDGPTAFTPTTAPNTGSGPIGSNPTGTTSPTTAPATVQPTSTAPVKGPPTLALTDRTGDVAGDGSGAPMTQPRADIVKAQADWSAKALVFAVQVAQPVNPAQDPNWASDGTYLDLLLDTNADGTPDFEVQYYFDPQNGLVANVSRAGDTSGTSLCGAEAGFTADGYTIAIDPACLGNPASVAFKASMYYDPDPANPNGDLASDTTPDSGFSGPVSKA